MIRKWGWGMLCTLVLFYLVHGLLLWRFSRQEPRVEVYLEGELSQAAVLLDAYEPRQEEGCLVIQGKELSPFTKTKWKICWPPRELMALPSMIAVRHGVWLSRA